MNTNSHLTKAIQRCFFLILLAWPQFSSAEQTSRILEDKELHTKGSFIAYAAPWSTYFGTGVSMKHGIDYADEIVVHPDIFPSKTDISWHWPLFASKQTGVYGYNAVSFGSYAGGIPEVPIAPRQVKSIGFFAVTYSCTYAPPIGEFNVLCEFFLTKKAKDTNTNLSEVGFFPHAGKATLSFANAGEQLGTFTDFSGRTWKVDKQSAPQGSSFYMFIPEGDVNSATIDFKGALDFLHAKGHVTGEEWFNGIAFGVEPIAGSGSLRIEGFSVDLR